MVGSALDLPVINVHLPALTRCLPDEDELVGAYGYHVRRVHSGI